MQSSRGYGQVREGRQDGNKKKRITTITVSSVVLVAMVVAVAVGVSRNNNKQGGVSQEPEDAPEMHTSMKAIKQICQPTDYQEACISSLSAVAGNTTDPKELVKLTFQIAVDRMKKAFAQSEVLQEAAKDPRTSQALQNCKELMDYAIDELKNSFNQVGSFDLSNLHEMIEDLKVWISASLTYQDTCLDGFENTTGHAGESMRKVMKSAYELTSNTLAIISQISSLLNDFQIPLFNNDNSNKRRLLSVPSEDGFPSWVSDGRRRLLSLPSGVAAADVVVAKDGSGDFKTITDALAKVPLKSNTTFVVYVKEGVYNEQVIVTKGMNNVMMVGDGKTKTVVAGNKNFVDGTPTFKTATVAVVGNGFIAKDMGFVNTAGPEKHQAVALRVQSDMSIFYNCQMDAYQDTLYAHTHRQFYRDCTISGTIDFIFGNSPVVFQNCNIVVRKPMDNQKNILTAQGRKEKREPTAIILQNCTIVADPEYYPVRKEIPTYLGRPWKQYSRTFIIQSHLDDLIQPVGWLPWSGNFALDTCFYAEFDNTGPGASLAERAKWHGVKNLSADDIAKFTVARFIQGDRWIKGTGVPYDAELLPIRSAPATVETPKAHARDA